MNRLGNISLSQRLLMVGLIPAALLTTLVTGLFLWLGTNAMDDALEERGVAIVSFLAPASEYAVISGNNDTQMALLQAVLEQADVTGAALFNRDGGLLAVSGRMQLVNPIQVIASTEAANIASNEHREGYAAPVVSEPLILEDVFQPDISTTRKRSAETIGWVYVELGKEAVEARKRDVFVSVLALLLAGLGLAGILASRLASSVRQPLAKLVDAVDRVGQGELATSVVDDAPSPELRALQRGFNNMAHSIAQAHDNLQSKIQEATSKLAFQALHDPLTGLPNRRAFEEALDNAVSQSRRTSNHATLCFIDLDRFKIVNDSCGHAAGDELLQNVAHLIRQRVRAGDLVSRIGGDEFALILNDCTPEAAKLLAENLREAVSSYRFQWDGRWFSVGASIGLVRIEGGTSSASELLVAADIACYAAKKSGRNQVVEHTPETNVGRRRTDVVRSTPPLFNAISFERLVLFRQAINPVGNAQPIDWLEVLIRLRGGDGKLHAAQKMLASLGLDDALIELDLWVAERVFDYTSATAANARFCVNVSAPTIAQPDQFWERLTALQQRCGIKPGSLVFEFPAKLAAQSPLESLQFVQMARSLGILIAIEKLDGGTSVLLRTLKPDFVKISLKDLSESFGLEAGCNLAQALCGMAEALSIPAIATEVEDPLMQQALETYGFAYAQGDLFSPPEPLLDSVAQAS